jgi:hypothetical protein
MRITKRQLRRIIRESMQGPGAESGAASRSSSKSWIGIKTYLELGDTASATNAVLDLFWMDDTWRQEEDALEDILGALPYTATTKEIQAASEGWLADYREGKFRPQTKEDMEADWARGSQPRIR